jgi:hypothetical protein
MVLREANGLFQILSHFLNLKTPTEDSILRHERALFITLGTIEKLACLLSINQMLRKKKNLQIFRLI